MQSSSEIKEKKSEEKKTQHVLEDIQSLKVCNFVIVDTIMFNY